MPVKPIYICKNGIGKNYVEDPVTCNNRAELLLNPVERIKLSKLMSAVLRHIPYEIGIEIDKCGWTDIDKLIEGIKSRWPKYSWITKDKIVAVAITDAKGRFEIKYNKIRARYGHSVPVNIKYKIDRSLEALYHGTSAEKLRSIMQRGLIPGRRLWVHLTTDPKIAIEIGMRHGGSPVLLKVDRKCLYLYGYNVYKASDLIRLVKRVPPKCIKIVKELGSF